MLVLGEKIASDEVYEALGLNPGASNVTINGEPIWFESCATTGLTSPQVWSTFGALGDVIDVPSSIKVSSGRKPEPERCLYCGVKALPEDRFCEGCGAPL